MTTRAATRDRTAIQRSMWASYSMLLVYGIALGLPGPAVPSLRAAYGLTYSGAALHLTVFSAGAAIGSALVDRASRRLTRTTLLGGALAGVAVGAALSGLAPSVTVSLAGVTTMGVCGVVAVNVAQGVLGAQHADRRATVLADAHVVSAVGLTTAALAVAGARAVGEWRLAFAAPVVVVAGILLSRQPRRLPPRSAGPTTASTATVSPALVVGSLVVGVAVAVEWAVTFWAATYLRDPVGLSPTYADSATVGVLAALILGRWLVARVARRHRAHRLLLLALATTVVAAIPYLVATSLPAPYATLVPVAALAVLCLSVATLFPLALAVTMSAGGGSADDQQGASAMALGVSAAGAVAVPYLLGAVADATSLTTALVAIPVGALVAVVGTTVTQRLARSQRPHPT